MQIKKLIVGDINTNCYLLSSQGELGIIDPGGEDERILAKIKELEAIPKFIINTHYHFDHTLVNKELKKITKAKILIHGAEKDFIDFSPDKFLRENDIVKIGEIKLKIIHIPGHTKGSICLLGDNFIFTGDTLFQDGCGRTDLEGASEKEMKESLEKLRKVIKPGMMVYPGHGEIFKFAA